MSTTAVRTNGPGSNAGPAPVDMKFEIVVIPGSDVDRAKDFYSKLGWRLDADYDSGKDFRVIQFTPPGSRCSIIFGKNVTPAAPGSAQGLYLIVSDIQSARQALLDRGIEVSEVFHDQAGVYAGPDDRELQLACVRAYNEWLAEFCDGGEGRLIGQAIVPTTGVDDAIAEVHAARALGHRGVVISAFPNGTLDAQPEDAPFWALVQELGLPVAVHIGSFVPARPGMKWPDTHELSFLGITGSAKAGAQQ